MANLNNLADPVIIVRLQEGLADRHRLPLSHVISVLDEVRQMVTEVGREIQSEKGVEGQVDFGLELIAGNDGIVFRQGSVEAAIAITTNVQNGFLAAQKVVKTVEQLRTSRKTQGEVDPLIVRRLSRIARVQRPDKTRLGIAVRAPEQRTPDFATVFDQAAIDCVRALQSPTFTIEGLTLFGKLTELRDKDEEEDSKRGFWGELKRENGESWRVQFKLGDLDAVTQLFRKQVSVTGKAFYFRSQSPKLIAQTISAEQERDYEGAFDEIFGSDKELYGNADFAELLKEMRGE